MKKDVFTVWLKEFCSLVFTQAVQAFLLAAIMSVVIATASGNVPANRGAAASATGIIAIIALTAISKIELLVKKIFGIESQFGDPSMKSGMAGLAGTLIGARLAGRVLNNVGKVGGGMNERRKAKMAEARAKEKMARDLAKMNTPASTDPTVVGAGGASGIAGGNDAGVPGIASASAGGSNGNATMNPNTLTINAGNVNVDGKGSPEDKRAAIMDKYQEEIEKAKAQRQQGLYKMLSGGAETAGAIAGGIGGAAIGMATGDGIFQKAGVGMGVGDYLGEASVRTVKNVHDVTVDVRKTNEQKTKATEAISDLTGKDISSYRNAVKELEKYTAKLGDITKDANRNTDAGNI